MDCHRIRTAGRRAAAQKVRIQQPTSKGAKPWNGPKRTSTTKTKTRCGSASPDCSTTRVSPRPTAPGKTLDSYKGYDSEHRIVWDCIEIHQGRNGLSCEMYAYGADGLPFSKREFNDCTLDASSRTTTGDYGRPNCSLEELYKVNYTYDGRRLLHREIHQTDYNAATRIKRYQYNLDGLVASIENPDSDGDGKPEVNQYVYGALGRMWRRLENGVAFEATYDGMGNMIKETRGATIVTTTAGRAGDGATMAFPFFQTHRRHRVCVRHPGNPGGAKRRAVRPGGRPGERRGPMDLLQPRPRRSPGRDDCGV